MLPAFHCVTAQVIIVLNQLCISDIVRWSSRFEVVRFTRRETPLTYYASYVIAPAAS